MLYYYFSLAICTRMNILLEYLSLWTKKKSGKLNNKSFVVTKLSHSFRYCFVLVYKDNTFNASATYYIDSIDVCNELQCSDRNIYEVVP